MNEEGFMNITVLGDGAFGTALAQMLAKHGHHITLWCYNGEVARQIAEKRCNEIYLPTIILNANILATTSLESAMQGADLIVEAIPMKFMRSVLESCKPSVNRTIPWVLATKGIEAEKLLLPSQVLKAIVGAPFVILSGPSFAEELALGQPTGVMLAAEDPTRANQVRTLIEGDTCFVQNTNDIVGVELCGALKNLAALSVGIVEGAGYGFNARALVLTQALHEIAKIVIAAGGKQDTVLSLAGVGDAVLTSYSSKSRNQQLGYLIGQGYFEKIEGSLAESVNTLISVKALSSWYAVAIPLFLAVYECVLHKKEVSFIIEACRT